MSGSEPHRWPVPRLMRFVPHRILRVPILPITAPEHADALTKEYAELFPYYMHLRFANTMLISPRSESGDALFERADNYYSYVKPWNVDDQLILQKMKFPGKPAGLDSDAAALTGGV